MGPKGGPSKKTEAKKQDKIIEDKTFGLKNKKGNKQQKFIEQVTTQVKFGNRKTTDALKEAQEKQEKKDAQQRKLDELNMLFKPVLSDAQKAAKQLGADEAKLLICEFFKQGLCSKGKKCKFSHDMSKDTKPAKKNIYHDDRFEENDKDMTNWDDAQLNDVVEKRHAESNAKKPKTDIICKYFLDAVENNKYGWFWNCPNDNDKCIYRHCLPQGFVLKKDKKKLDDQNKENQISIEELIESERANLGCDLTPVTLQSFLQWKKKKRQEKVDQLENEKAKKKDEYSKAGRMAVGMSGRLLFEFNPDMIQGDDDEADTGVITREDVSDDEDESETAKKSVRQIDANMFSAMAVEVDVSDKRMSKRAPIAAKPEQSDTTATASNNGTTASGVGEVEVNEDLFDDEDLEGQLDDLNLLNDDVKVS